MRTRSSVFAAAAAVTVAVLTVTGNPASAGFGESAGTAEGAKGRAAAAQKPPTGGQGIGDPYYPSDGNLGYDVADYTVKLSYDPAAGSIAATTTITARATSALSSFNLDFGSLTIDQLTVNGQPATYRREFAHELVVTPAAAVASGTTFTTAVTYHGVPEGVAWKPQNDGAVVVLDEPHSATVWYPSNDHPQDKATFHLEATVPAPYAVVSNGTEGATTTAPGPGGSTLTTYRWNLVEPTTTYLTYFGVDKLTFKRSTLADGTPVVDTYAPGATGQQANEAKLPEIIDLLEEKWGPYPATAAGGHFLDTSIGFSLETYTRPVYTAGAGIQTIAHELAHQWWGDHVSIKYWRDICLNECFASYSQWLWDEHNGTDLDARYKSSVERLGFKYKLYDMGAGNEFTGGGVYTKGKYFLHALRHKLGNDAFYSSLRAVLTEYADRNISMPELRDELAERTGVDLTSFWAEWMGTRKPSFANLYPGSLGG
ncbi:M1 family metallopeptidase [Nocardioides speluncae]|uniref:M1 family metallopeptidase n=1 Tax=Nocardioides speluncae TaxID=2670337 RepID=UPI000D692ED1|nr:M1 family metallopeptidase [Nocardioides speluncae]